MVDLVALGGVIDYILESPPRSALKLADESVADRVAVNKIQHES